ncbi:MAG: S8 family serine peptidase [Bacteroidota bacterium]|nr:S8 family serine peptidase [Bacteroidota bacterium]
MYKLLISLFLIFGFSGVVMTGNIKSGQDQNMKKGYRPGILVVKYNIGAAIAPGIKVLKNGSTIAQVGITSLDQLHQQLKILSISKDEIYTPKDVRLSKILGIDRIWLLKVDTSLDIEAVANQYSLDPNVEFANPDWQVYHAAIPTDPHYSKQWGHNNTAQMPSYNWSTNLHNGPLVGTVGFDANAEAAWSNTQGYGSSSIAIAIIDGGVEWSHPDLSANIWTNPGETGAGKETNGIDDDVNGKVDDWHGWDFGTNDNNPDDNSADPGHGTACAGVAAAIANNSIGVAGIAAGCKIMALKAADNTGAMYFSYINNAIYYAADMGAKIISMSLGASTQDAANQTACTYAWNKGTVVLAATGNENKSTISYPAANTNVVAVGAASNCGDRKRSSSSLTEVNPGVSTDPNGYTCDGERWWGSNYGSTTKDAVNAVDVIAPTILPTTDRVGANGYDPSDYDLYFNGTSAATPYAAGVAALIFSRYPSMTSQQVRSQLRNTSQDIVNVESVAGWDRYTGYGMVDAAAATAPPSLTITSPNGGENWTIASTRNITWITIGIISNVKLEYTTDGTTYTVIAASTPNSGTYSWTIPNTPSTTVKVRVSDAADAATNDISNANFTIGSAPIQASTNKLDDFNRANSNTVGNTPTTPTSLTWNEIETVSSTAIQINSNRLQLGSTTAGRDFCYIDLNSLTGYPTQLNLAGGIMTWAFNFRQTRTDPSGFDAGNYGIAFILCKTTNDVTTGDGYAVIIGQSGTADPIRLARFTGGPDANSNFTNIISGNDYGNEYISVKVTYNPTGDNWSLYAESNASSFPQANPGNTTTQIGSTTSDNTFTASTLRYMGCFWNHSTGSSDNAIFDDIYLSDPSGSLPIQLASFVGRFVSDGAAKLEWETISEVNNYGFWVQKYNPSVDGYETIEESFQAGAGSTLKPQQYSWVDENATGSEQYMLKQQDNDGLVSYFGPIIMLNPTNVPVDAVPSVFALNQNYPNPFNPTTIINYQLATDNYTTLKVYNILGNEVAILFNGNAEAGKLYNVKFDATKLSTGMYIYKLQSGNSVEVRKLTLVK